ncbi:MAG: hypothetical protein AAGI34_09400 [Pseudomonadota bacterium]
MLNGQATAEAKSQDGASEMTCPLKMARGSAVMAKSQAIITLKTLIINAPAELRDTLDQIKGRIGLVRHIVAMVLDTCPHPWPLQRLPCARSPGAGWLCAKKSRGTKRSLSTWFATGP